MKMYFPKKSIIPGGNMSSFQFLASNKLLKEVKNPYIEIISINEALRRNMRIEESLMNNINIDRDKEMLLFFDSEEHLGEMEIKNVMYYSSRYAEEYSNKQYFSELSWDYTEARAKQLVEYLKEQMNSLDEIEIWSIWLDEHKSASIKSVHINELSITDLEFLNLLKGYETPKCLIIKR